jgi:triosephosphate isomerase (TIM)
MTTRRPIIVGNWKMNLGGRQSLGPARQLIAAVGPEDSASAELVILPPFTALPLLQDLTEATPSALQYGAQDISTDDAGAYTGEISGSMLAELRARYALAGHSEGRARHGEDGASVNAKISAEITAQPDIDGALVGGASLDPAELTAIWRAAA